MKSRKFSRIYISIFICIILFFLNSNKVFSQNIIVQDTVIKLYTVQNGENLYTIAFKFQVSKELICKVNGYKELNELKLITGHKIKIPALINRTVVIQNQTESDLTSTINEDSIQLYRQNIQKIEDSLFLIYVALDKRRDSISKFNEKLIIQNNYKKTQSDSILNANKEALKQLNIKDSIDRFNNIQKKENEYKKFKEDSILLETTKALRIEKIKDSTENYNNLIKKQLEYKKYKQDSINLIKFQNQEKLRIKDSVIRYDKQLKKQLENEKILQDSILKAEIKILKINDSIKLFKELELKEKAYIEFQHDSMIENEARLLKRIDSIDAYKEQSKINLKNKLLEDSIKNYSNSIISKNEKKHQLDNTDIQIEQNKDTIISNHDEIKIIDTLLNDTLENHQIEYDEDSIRIDTFISKQNEIKIIDTLLNDTLESHQIDYDEDSIRIDTFISKQDDIKILDTLQNDTLKNHQSKFKHGDRIKNIKIDSVVFQDTTQIPKATQNIIDNDTLTQSKDLSTVEIKATKIKKRKKIGDKIDKSDIEKSSFYLSRALKAIDVKEYENAQIFIKKSINLNPNYTEAYMLLGDLFASFNYFDKAVKEYSNAILTNNNMPVLYYNRGSNYLKMNELTKSLLDFNAAINLDSQYVLAIGGRAAVFVLRKNYQLAIHDYDKIIELNSFFTPAYKARAFVRIETNDFKGAIEDCNKFLETNPTDAYILFQRGMAQIKDGEFFKSCNDLLKSSNLGYSEATNALKKYCK